MKTTDEVSKLGSRWRMGVQVADIVLYNEESDIYEISVKKRVHHLPSADLVSATELNSSRSGSFFSRCFKWLRMLTKADDIPLLLGWISFAYSAWSYMPQLVLNSTNLP